MIFYPERGLEYLLQGDKFQGVLCFYGVLLCLTGRLSWSLLCAFQVPVAPVEEFVLTSLVMNQWAAFVCWRGEIG